ncbi:tyrosine-protein kinase family protein [Colwellia sp. 6M3]|jgi:receptor protein-tyrosine kinase|uniref:XrtA-associated tyrosine autokinase n=1 Tax=Colwellia sp. 6M3 TaxID=2759849 RepID=UPI0015F4B3EE|nr:XrtA-associated tyrosine autokinase [Colwellia sp. 6M3]MBA6417391.1 tyrosine-protein kinase family protein [Colwellia sp. 6M3]|tara:strand:- start:1635 stop:2486 length:852 start_codon:yes stop_codon:yes gene_type:complete
MSIIEKALAKQQQKNNQTSVEVEQQTPQEETSNNTVDLSPKDILALDKTGLAERGYLIDNGTRKSIKDEFRQIKRKLLNNAFGNASKTLHHSNLIMVSSAKPNEGKTFVAINLALSIALEQDKTVLLIDADVLRPSVVRELGVEEKPGLIEYLLGKSEKVSDIIYNTDIDKLKLIPAGKPHHLSNELLASEKMATLANELANRYPDRIVIFDCPPLIGVTETLVLASLMGQGVIVVEESKSSIADIQAATRHLNEDLALGLVLNKAIRSHKDLYGYYGYGYGA